jgi:hypothetical protein
MVLSVALAAALLAVVAPALEDARQTRTERLTERELGRVEAAALTLTNEEEPGARRTLSISLSEGSPTTAPLAFVALGGIPDGEQKLDTADGDVFAYRVAGGRIRVRRVEADLRVVRDGEPTENDSEPLVLHGGGTYQLTLRLVQLDGPRTILVNVKET